MNDRADDDDERPDGEDPHSPHAADKFGWEEGEGIEIEPGPGGDDGDEDDDGEGQGKSSAD